MTATSKEALSKHIEAGLVMQIEEHQTHYLMRENRLLGQAHYTGCALGVAAAGMYGSPEAAHAAYTAALKRHDNNPITALADILDIPFSTAYRIHYAHSMEKQPARSIAFMLLNEHYEELVDAILTDQVFVYRLP